MLNHLKFNNLVKVLTYLKENENKIEVDKIRKIISDRMDKEQLKLNTENIILRINNILDKLRMSDYIIRNDTKLEEYIQMKEVAKNAICTQRVSLDNI